MAYMTEDNKDYVRTHAQDLGITGLSKQLGFHPETIRNFCKREGIAYKGRRNSFNEFFFENIDTEEKAYILGLWYADGYVLSPRNRKGIKEQRSFGISLNTKDKNILEKIKLEMQATHPINIYQEHGFARDSLTESYYGRIVFTSDIAVQHLERLGCGIQKTTTLVFPSAEQVPDHLIQHFIRGYFDGDGSISRWMDNCKTKHYKYNMSICGTYEFLQGVQSFFGTSVKLSQRHPERAVNNYTLAYCGNQQILRLMSIIYKNANIYIDRKYEQFIELEKIC